MGLLSHVAEGNRNAMLVEGHTMNNTVKRSTTPQRARQSIIATSAGGEFLAQEHARGVAKSCHRQLTDSDMDTEDFSC